MRIKYVGLIALLMCSLTACVISNLKAPCDHYANFCGSKIQINT